MDNELKLPKTRLEVRDGILYKKDKSDLTVGKFPLVEIVSIRFEKSMDSFGILFSVTFFALAVVSKIFIPNNGWAWFTGIICLSLMFMSLLVTKSGKIVIETHRGIVRYTVDEIHEIAIGFVHTLDGILHSDSGYSIESHSSTNEIADQQSGDG
ncbi:MAG: hypothetical protein IID32_06860 [Planctomycetes bacterium]|nr:hypothetical protein [Planctomycetota bacterium]